MGSNASRWVLAALAVVLVVSSFAFGVDVRAADRPDPVEFRETIKVGMTAAETVSARLEGVAIPRAEVYYSQYRYAVGYYGVTSLVEALGRPGHARQFGRPTTVWVSDFAGENASLTASNRLTVEDELDGWVAAERAHFVVDSPARTPGGPAVVPFSERAAADRFADRYGGRVVDWAELRTLRFDDDEADRAAFEATAANRTRWADRTVAGARDLLERPVSVVVGEDAPTLAAAVAAAPANTTVRVPAGTYRANVTVDKPLTIRGAGNETHLRGPGNGSVITARADRVAVADLAITGVGATKSVESAPGGGDWDYRVQLGYGYGDAGVVVANATGSYVRDVSVTTPANGVLVRWSDGTVVENATVYGSKRWADGFMGVMDMDSRIVVQDSTFVGGRDGVYTHLGHRSVVRDNRMVGMRFGVHEMYTSDALLANNTVRGANVGLVVMTRPSGNLLVGNDVRDSGTGINVAGASSYVADNVVVNNSYGLRLTSRRSLWTSNVAADNDVGIDSSTLFPTNRVTDNDVVGNDRQALATLGPLRVWRDNYWAGAPGWDGDGDGTVDRPFRPTGAVDGIVHETPGAATLAGSPAVAVRRAVSASLPGLRATGVVDVAPRARPVHPGVLDRVGGENRSTVRGLGPGPDDAEGGVPP